MSEPTVVLVHGAFEDASNRRPVFDLCRRLAHQPPWAVFGTADRPVAPELHRFQCARAGSTVTEVEGASHLVMLSRPDTVADAIRRAMKECATNRSLTEAVRS